MTEITQSAPAAVAESPLITYWKQGHTIIEACLKKAVAADPSDAPIPLTGDAAALWHRAQAAAYLHAIEMLSYPAEFTMDEIAETNAAVARQLDKQASLNQALSTANPLPIHQHDTNRSQPVALEDFLWGNTLRDTDRERLRTEIREAGHEPTLAGDSSLYLQWLRS